MDTLPDKENQPSYGQLNEGTEEAEGMISWHTTFGN